MTLADITDYVASLGIAEHVYMAKMQDKRQKTIGVYNASRNDAYLTAIGGVDLHSYGVYNISLLVHWNKSPRETEDAAERLFSALERTQETTVNEETIKFIRPLYGASVDVGTDDSGIYERVIEAAVVYKKGA